MSRPTFTVNREKTEFAPYLGLALVCAIVAMVATKWLPEDAVTAIVRWTLGFVIIFVAVPLGNMVEDDWTSSTTDTNPNP